MNKRFINAFSMIMVIALLFSACGSKASAPDVSEAAQSPAGQETKSNAPKSTGQTDAAAPEQTPAAADASPDPDDEPFLDDDMIREQAYIDAMQYFVDMGELPDGTSIYYEETGGEGDKYAIFDIDGDGKEELIVNVTETIMASSITQIYEYDPESGEWWLQLNCTPFDNHFYTNGKIFCGMSHGTGREAEDFWPYDVYEYSPEDDMYLYKASAYQWDGSAVQEYMGEKFPADIDTDKNLQIYTLYRSDVPEEDNEAYIDDGPYYEWYYKTIGDGNEFDLEWMYTEALVHPNGDPMPEPVG